MKAFKGKIELLTERYVSAQENSGGYGTDGGGPFTWRPGVWRVCPHDINPERYVLSKGEYTWEIHYTVLRKIFDEKIIKIISTT